MRLGPRSLIGLGQPSALRAVRPAPPSKGGGLPSYLGVVTTKNHVLDKRQASANTGNAVVGVYLREDVNGNFIVSAPGWYWDRLSTKQELSLGGITYDWAVEVGGVRYPVTWGGAPTVTVTGMVEVESDPVAGLVAASGTAIKHRVWVSCPGGVPFKSIPADTTVGDVFEYGTDLPSRTASGTPTQTLVGTMWAPLACVAITAKPTVLLAGSDSIFSHFNDDYTGGNKDLTLARCFGAELAYINAGSYGDTMVAFIANHARRVALKRYCTHVPLEIGVNDLSNGRTAAQMIADRATIEGYFSDKITFNLDIVPKTTTTDAWLTTANQTPAVGFEPGGTSQRGLFNAAMRAKPNYKAFGSVMETALETGIWKADGTGGGKYTTDGLHLWKSSWVAYVAAAIFTPATFVR